MARRNPANYPPVQYEDISIPHFTYRIVNPHTRCKLKLLRLERVKDYLLMEEEFIQNMELKKPREEKQQEERTKIDELRGSPLQVGTLEELIDDKHGEFDPPRLCILFSCDTAIVSGTHGPEYYVPIM